MTIFVQNMKLRSTISGREAAYNRARASTRAWTPFPLFRSREWGRLLAYSSSLFSQAWDRQADIVGWWARCTVACYLVLRRKICRRLDPRIETGISGKESEASRFRLCGLSAIVVNITSPCMIRWNDDDGWKTKRQGTSSCKAWWRQWNEVGSWSFSRRICSKDGGRCYGRRPSIVTFGKSWRIQSRSKVTHLVWWIWLRVMMSSRVNKVAWVTGIAELCFGLLYRYDGSTEAGKEYIGKGSASIYILFLPSISATHIRPPISTSTAM